MRKIPYILLSLVIPYMLVMPALAFASVPALSPSDVGGAALAPGVVPSLSSPDAHWIWAVLASPVFVGVLTWLGKFIDNWIRERRFIRENAELRELYDFAAYGADNTYFNFVRRLKNARADGKLTEDEKNTAMDMAIKEAVAYARENGGELLKSVGPNMLRRLIEQVLSDRKAGRYVTGPLAPLPELQP